MAGEYSQWKLTFDPAAANVVLLDYNQKLAADLKFPLKNGLDVINTPDSAWPLLLATGNSAVTLAFEIYADTADDKSARAAILNSLINTALLTIKPLKIQILGYTDRYWTFAACSVAEYEPSRYLSAPTPRVLAGYKLTCVGLSYTGP